MKATTLTAMLMALGVGVAALVGTGCESTNNDEQTLIIDPPSTTAVGRVSIALVARASSTNTIVVLPLAWSVENASLGRILSSGGMGAVYESYGKYGANAVIVRDESGQEGVCAISSQELPEILTGEPVTTTL